MKLSAIISILGAATAVTAFFVPVPHQARAPSITAAPESGHEDSWPPVCDPWPRTDKRPDHRPTCVPPHGAFETRTVKAAVPEVGHEDSWPPLCGAWPIDPNHHPDHRTCILPPNPNPTPTHGA